MGKRRAGVPGELHGTPCVQEVREGALSRFSPTNSRTESTLSGRATPQAASVDPETSRAAAEAGLEVHLEATEYTMAGLVAAIAADADADADATNASAPAANDAAGP